MSPLRLGRWGHPQVEVRQIGAASSVSWVKLFDDMRRSAVSMVALASGRRGRAPGPYYHILPGGAWVLLGRHVLATHSYRDRINRTAAVPSP